MIQEENVNKQGDVGFAFDKSKDGVRSKQRVLTSSFNLRQPLLTFGRFI